MTWKDPIQHKDIFHADCRWDLESKLPATHSPVVVVGAVVDVDVVDAAIVDIVDH